jgi:hypothetical protein
VGIGGGFADGGFRFFAMTLLRERQQGIERLQIRRFHDDLRRGRKLRMRLRQGDHRGR